MKFEIDKQTIKDLEIFGSENSDSSIFNFYNKTKTNGGRDFLTEMMKNPLTDIIEINKICFIATLNLQENYTKDSYFE